MKHFTIIASLLLSTFGGQLMAQTTTAVGDSAQRVPSPTAYHVIKNDANSRVWQREVYEKTRDGHVVPQIHKFTELRTGVNFWDGTSWRNSKEEVMIQRDGTAAALAGAYQVRFPADIYQGLIQSTNPNGAVLESQPCVLAMDDGENSIIIGILTNSTGQLVGTNQVIYKNAFSGVDADIIYTYRLSGLEQDVIIRSRSGLPTPKSVGLIAAKTRLQILTEFVNPPEPEVVTQTDAAEDNEPDSTLKFGVTTFGHGKAFMLGNEHGKRSQEAKVYKSWIHLQGRTFLIEAVPYLKVASQLQGLPQSGSAAKPESSKLYALRTSSGRYHLPAARFASATRKAQFVKAEGLNDAGFCLDYVTVNQSYTNFIFQGDSTYYVGGEYSLCGTTRIEGGTVIKMDFDGKLDIDSAGSIECKTDPYRMGIFTSVNDDSQGEPLDISSGSPAVGDVNDFLYIDAPYTVLSNLRMSYTYATIVANGDLDLWDCQFSPVDVVVAYANNVGLHNVLIQAVWGDIPIQAEGYAYAENVTADSTISLGVNAETNCIEVFESYGDPGAAFVPVGGAEVYTNGVDTGSPAASIFEPVGAGYFYLAPDSPYRETATTNVSPALLADLAKRTTYPPMVISNTAISVATTNSPQAPRDNLGTLDMGYHYAPLDYIYGNVEVASNLVFTAGTAVGWYDSSGWGLGADPGVQIQFNGTATQPCAFALYSTVQEENVPSWVGLGWVYFGVAAMPTEEDPNYSALVQANFTHFYVQAGRHVFVRDYEAVIRLWANNSEFYDAGEGGYGLGLCMTNCLFDRMYIGAQAECCAQIAWRNCTMYGGTLLATHWGSWPVTITNCAFDGVAFSMDSSSTACGFNAYITNGATLPITHASDVYVTNFNWETSWFGNYYLPTNSPLINAGSTTADQVQLYHFTTQTNQVPETNSVVDIGYHYVATDADGNPLDSNGDGTPDYLQDPNGNGIFDTGDPGDWRASINGSGNLPFSNGFNFQIFEAKPQSYIP